MSNMINQNLDKLNGAAGDLKHTAQKAGGQMERMSHEASERLGDMASDLVHRTSEYVESGRGYVEENPGKSVAIAAAVGLIAGSLLTLAMRRRSSDRD